MKRFKSARQAQRFLSVHDQVANLFRRPANTTATDQRKSEPGPSRPGPKWRAMQLASERLIP